MDFIKPNSIKNIHKLSIAPMMDCTDKHFRMIMRKISSEALLYTEMIVCLTRVLTRTNAYNNYESNSMNLPLCWDLGIEKKYCKIC